MNLNCFQPCVLLFWFASKQHGTFQRDHRRGHDRHGRRTLHWRDTDETPHSSATFLAASGDEAGDDRWISLTNNNLRHFEKKLILGSQMWCVFRIKVVVFEGWCGLWIPSKWTGTAEDQAIYSFNDVLKEIVGNVGWTTKPQRIHHPQVETQFDDFSSGIRDFSLLIRTAIFKIPLATIDSKEYLYISIIYPWYPLQISLIQL